MSPANPTPEPVPASPRAAQLIEELLEGAEVVDRGEFELDAAAARRKMSQFQYRDRGAYLIPLVEGMFALGATRVDIDRLGPDLQLSFPGVQVDEAAARLADVFGRAVKAGEDLASYGLGRVGVAIDMAVGHDGIERVVIDHVTSESHVVVEYGEAGPRTLKRPEGEPGTRVLVDRRIRLGASELEEELERLAEAVTSAAPPVGDWGRDDLAQTLDFVRTETLDDGLTFVAGLSRVEQPSYIDWSSQGLRVDGEELEHEGFVAQVAIDRPRFDLSQATLADDDRVRSAREAIRSAHLAALAELAAADAAWETGNATRPAHWPRWRVDDVLGHPRRESPPRPVVPVAPDAPLRAAAAYTFGMFGALFTVAIILMALTKPQQLDSEAATFGVMGVGLMGICVFGLAALHTPTPAPDGEFVGRAKRYAGRMAMIVGTFVLVFGALLLAR